MFWILQKQFFDQPLNLTFNCMRAIESNSVYKQHYVFKKSNSIWNDVKVGS